MLSCDKLGYVFCTLRVQFTPRNVRAYGARDGTVTRGYDPQELWSHERKDAAGKYKGVDGGVDSHRGWVGERRGRVRGWWLETLARSEVARMVALVRRAVYRSQSRKRGKRGKLYLQSRENEKGVRGGSASHLGTFWWKCAREFDYYARSMCPWIFQRRLIRFRTSAGEKKRRLLRLSVARFSSVDERTDRRSENAIENRGDKSKACNIRAVPAGDGWN